MFSRMGGGRARAGRTRRHSGLIAPRAQPNVRRRVADALRESIDARAWRFPGETELRPIVPMVFYLGSGRWRYAAEFSEGGIMRQRDSHRRGGINATAPRAGRRPRPAVSGELV